jgi:serine/threonine protein kinase/TolB-like protein
MGEVYRARDEQLDRDVAIKLLVGDLADVDSRGRLLREARAAGGLNHPSICTIYMVGEADGVAFIAMELVDGQSLAAALRRGPLPIDQLLELGGQIADALAHAHHIVHRDLKSANVMVTAEGRAKVLDFGLARRTVDAEPTEATRVVTVTHGGAGAIVGTPAYMSPEQLRGEPADARSDVWALGIVLYEMTTGRRPFAGHSSDDLSAHILHDPPAAIPAAVPLALRSVIDRCLQKDAPCRYQSAAEVAEALRSIRDGTTSQVATVRYYVSKRPILTALLVASVLLVAIGVVNGRRVRSWITGAATVESIAVLPLENLSGDAAQDFFADGMTEVLSTDLARLGGLKRVTARGSVVRYKGSQKPLADIARELKVDALLTGSVMRAGNRVSITAQLLDPATGSRR